VSDNLLINPVRSFVRELKQKKLISKAFFIRYGDPHFHIRLRIRMEKRENISDVLLLFHKFHQKLLKTGSVNKVLIDTYEREFERYGHGTMIQSEEIFSANSTIILEFLHKLRHSPENYQARLYFGLALSISYIHSMINDINNRKAFTDFGFNSYAVEFELSKNKGLKKELSELYRYHAKNISLLEKNMYEENAINVLVQKHAQDTKKVFEEVKALQFNKSDMDSVRWLISHIHMLYNRLFSRSQRKEELKMYYLLSNYYKSMLARSMKSREQPVIQPV
jgi:thiopeptide-type bacteriocin biosynthesis protein